MVRLVPEEWGHVLEVGVGQGIIQHGSHAHGMVQYYNIVFTIVNGNHLFQEVIHESPGDGNVPSQVQKIVRQIEHYHT